MTNNYDASSIKVLKGLEAVRKRPGMYIGGTGIAGLQHLIKELVDNAIDEVLAGYCDTIKVIIHKDNSVTVEDNGRGIPVDIHPELKKSSLEVVFTTLHAGGKFDKDSYKVSGGLHGVGASVVNALSKKLHVYVKKNGKEYFQEYIDQKPTSDVKVLRENVKGSGTKVTFWPDEKIFKEINYDYKTLKKRLREFAFLNSGVKITLKDERTGNFDVFKFDGGLKEFVKFLSKGSNHILPEVLSFSGEKEGIEVDIGLTYTTNYSETVEGFVNNINTPGGGTHITGFRIGLTRSINEYISKNGSEKIKKFKLSGEDVREGLVAVVSVKVPEPQFEGQTKEKLGNPEAQTIVQQIFYDNFYTFLDENPKSANKIIDKAISSYKARAAARKARELVRRKSALEFSSMPGKLADCSIKDPEKAELFLVEGDSAGGSAKQARFRNTQAILPLKGKIINVEKARIDKVLSNEEIKTLITALGTGIGDNFDINKLRYHKIIIMTDADVDGNHIDTLLLTFFYRHFKELILRGYVYLAIPPLYKFKVGKKEYYLYSDEELEEFKKQFKDKRYEIQRYKGLGEMNPEQLWETTLNPETRMLKKVTINDAAEADHYFSILMGEAVEPRREFIVENAKFVKELDI